MSESQPQSDIRERPRAVLDASVLYPATIRDVLMRLSVAGFFQPKWTERIHEEWMRNLLQDRPQMTRQQVERIRVLMDTHGGDWHVPPCDSLVPTLTLPDPDDRHVLAAAIVSRSKWIITSNLRHFPPSSLVEVEVVARHPDDFVCSFLTEEPEQTLATLARHRAALQRPPRSVEEYLAMLRKGGLKKFASLLEPHAVSI